MSKTLITYFSASNVTKTVAEKMATLLEGDLYEIQPEVAYTAADLDWRNKNSRSTIEMTNQALRPAIIKGNLDLSAYDTIYVGFPIWWGIASTIVNTFLEAYDFSGKTVVVYATSGGSGMGATVEKLKPSLSPSTTIIEGAIITKDVTLETIQSWK